MAATEPLCKCSQCRLRCTVMNGSSSMARGPRRSLLGAVAAEMGCSVIAGADAGSAESVHGYGARAVLAHHAPDWPGEAHRLMDGGGGGGRGGPGALRHAPAAF